MKKILFLIPNLKHGGAEKVLVNLVNNLDEEKYNVTVQTLFDVGVHKKNLSNHIKYKHVFPFEFRGNTYLFKLFSPKFWWELLIKEEYDLAISFLEGPTTRILSGCSNTKTKKVAWLHIELNTPKLAALGFRSIKEAQIAYDNFDNVVAVSHNVKESFLKQICLNHDIEILYNTNETGEILNKSMLPINDKRFIKDSTPNICSVAKLMKTKGFDMLLNVHKRLLAEKLVHRVYILGIGEEKTFLESQIKISGLQDSFILLGFDENPYKYVANCDLYVCSSRREGFSTAVTEALIVGTPVVSTNCSGAKELLGDNNEYGIVVDKNEEGIYQGIKKLLCDKKLLAHYRAQAKLRGSYFNKEKTVAAVEKMFEEILNE